MMAENNSNRILKLGVEEILEDLTYNVAYNEVLNRLKVNGMDSNVLEDAINSGITIMFSSALMLYMQKQEALLQKIVDSAIALLVVVCSKLPILYLKLCRNS